MGEPMATLSFILSLVSSNSSSETQTVFGSMRSNSRPMSNGLGTVVMVKSNIVERSKNERWTENAFNENTLNSFNS